MACSHVESLSLSPPTSVQPVYREDCTQCFDSIDEPSGLDVCLQCFNGGCPGVRLHSQLHAITKGHPLVVNIRRTRKHISKDEPPAKMTKLAITAETEADRYEYHTAAKCLDCNTVVGVFHSKVALVIEGIMKANTFSRQAEVQAWSHEVTACEHTLMLQQQPPRQLSQALGHCSGCDLKENLWLCLECGNLGCGRAQFGGIGGNGHGLVHANGTGHGVAVKLGSITPEGTADVYCYNCDDERLDHDLAVHLAHWGIVISDQVKTEKTTTEMTLEQNLSWAFSMTGEDGQDLIPIFGPGLTGLRNLGNSCYMASILQCLFDLPAFEQRYQRPSSDLPIVDDPAQDLETQLCKVADGLLSGRYSKPDPDMVAPDHDGHVTHQKGLAPSMFKHLIGKGHAEFSTIRQQDAFELFQHLVKLISRSQHPVDMEDPTHSFRFVMEQRLQCLSCKKVRYQTNEQEGITLQVPIEKLPSVEGEGTKYRPVTLKECLDRFTGTEVVDLGCASCGGKGFMKRSLFRTFPDTLVLNVTKMTMDNWVGVKVDVPIIVGDDSFSLDEYLSRGLQANEELLPEDETAAPAGPIFVANEAAAQQLSAMGFSRNSCGRALHATGNTDAEAAMNWLFEHMDDADLHEPLVLQAPSTAGGSGGAGPGSEQIETLTGMGFTVPQARKALRETGSDVERAVDWVFNHPDDEGDLDVSDGGAASAEPPSKKEAGSAELPASFQLRSIVCHKGTSIHAGHYVAFIRKILDTQVPKWVLFNDEKVVEANDIEEMKKTAYVYFFKRRS